MLVHDPHADPKHAVAEHGVELSDLADLNALDAQVVPVAHGAYLDVPREELLGRIRRGGILIDVKSTFPPKSLPEHLTYWSL